MDKLQIIVEGYARPSDSEDSYFATCSTTLINSNGKNVLVDPGADRNALTKGLDKAGVNIEDIDILFLTHWHPDHFSNIQLLPHLEILDGFTLYKHSGEEVFPNIDEPIEIIPETNIKVVTTPGHREEHVSLMVDDEKLGKVCVAQDVFWWEDGQQPANPTVEELLSKEDPFAADQEELVESRRKILDSGCEWIIPGHGKMFKNPKSK